jgi:hypothetical protein
VVNRRTCGGMDAPAGRPRLTQIGTPQRSARRLQGVGPVESDPFFTPCTDPNGCSEWPVWGNTCRSAAPGAPAAERRELSFPVTIPTGWDEKCRVRANWRKGVSWHLNTNLTSLARHHRERGCLDGEAALPFRRPRRTRPLCAPAPVFLPAARMPPQRSCGRAARDPRPTG